MLSLGQEAASNEIGQKAEDWLFFSPQINFKMPIKALVDQRESLFGHGDERTMEPGEGASLHAVFIKWL